MNCCYPPPPKERVDVYATETVLNLKALGSDIVDTAQGQMRNFSTSDRNKGVTTSTNYTKFNDRSLYFDGTGYLIDDGLREGLSSFIGDFTIETWVLITSRKNRFPALFSNYANWPKQNGLAIFLDHSNGGNFSVAAAGIFPALKNQTTVPYGEFFHYAITRENSVMKGWLNGKPAFSTPFTTSVTFQNNPYWIGNAMDIPSTGQIHGYIDGYRITKVARYSEEFIPERFL